MKRGTKQRIADSVFGLVYRLRLYAARVVIWNAELSEVEHLLKIAEGLLTCRYYRR